MTERLRELLAAATPGPWHAHDRDIELGVTDYEPGDPALYCTAVGHIYDEGGHTDADAAYIAACDPDTIRDLLDAHDRMAGALRACIEAGDLAWDIRADLIRDGSLSLYAALEPLRYATELARAELAALEGSR